MAKKGIVQHVTGGLLERAKTLGKKTLRELYWSLAFDEKEDAKRFAVFYFKEDADDDVVLAQVEHTGKQIKQNFGKVTRHKKKGTNEQS